MPPSARLRPRSIPGCLSSCSSYTFRNEETCRLDSQCSIARLHVGSQDHQARSRPVEGVALPKNGIENRLAQIRKNRGMAAAELAKRVNVSRQTIYAIEAGTFVPNTEVALRMARELEVAFDELFSLSPAPVSGNTTVMAEVLSASPASTGQPVRICHIGSRWVGVPVSATPYYLPEADGVIKNCGPQRPGGTDCFRQGRSRPEATGAGGLRSRREPALQDGGTDERGGGHLSVGIE